MQLTSNRTGMLLLAAWSTNGWLPSGHAMRMALDLGLHRALEKLADDTGKQRTQEEERDLGGRGILLIDVVADLHQHSVVSARIWLCLYWFDHQYVPNFFRTQVPMMPVSYLSKSSSHGNIFLSWTAEILSSLEIYAR